MPQDAISRYAELRTAERYRDSLPPGAAERDGADELVRAARVAYERALHGLADRMATGHADPPRPDVGGDDEAGGR